MFKLGPPACWARQKNMLNPRIEPKTPAPRESIHEAGNDSKILVGGKIREKSFCKTIRRQTEDLRLLYYKYTVGGAMITI